MNNRLQILYQKTEFNHHKISQLKGIFRCTKCKKNNTIMSTSNQVQFCIYCNMPNNIANNNVEAIKNLRS